MTAKRNGRLRRTLGVAAVLLWPALAAAQTGTVTGVVTDSATGGPAVGAQVTVVGTSVGGVTAENGRYLLKSVPAGTQTLRVQSLGYATATRTVTVTAGGTAVVDVALESKAVELTGLVVVGYGEKRKIEVTSAVSSIDESEIANVPTASLDAALQGKASGVEVTQNAGNPGNGISVRVRGSASISASNQPLYVVDGVPILREDFSQLGMGGQNLSAITGLSPDEIESIDILKDASAAAIYGSRGSNGVVLITTKRGKAGASHFSFSAYTGVQQAERRLDLLNASQYLEFMNESAVNDGLGANYYGIPGVSDRVDTDWQEAVLRPAPVNNMSAAFSGGTDRLRYYLSGSYFNQGGIVVGSAYDRAAGRINLDFSPADPLDLKASVSVSRENNDRVQGDGSLYGVVTYAISESPLAPVRRPTGTFTGPSDGLIYYNPVALGELDPTTARTLRSIGSLEAQYRMAAGLRLHGRVGYDVLDLRETQWQSPRVEGTYPASAGGVSKSGYSGANRYLAETFLDWDLPLPIDNRLSATAGASVERNTWDLNFIRGEGFTREETHQVSNAAIITDFDGTKGEHNLVSVFSRANYSLLDRYFLSGSLRADASSRFGPNQRWGVFPSVSAGWLLTGEPFMQDVAPSVLSTLRLRASWGETGNESIGDYPYQGLFGSSNYGDTPGLAPSTLANPDLHWETTRELNGGLDAGLFGERVVLGFDVYHKTTSDLLLNRPIPTTSGFSSVYANVGEMTNKGWELSLETRNVDTGADGFRWTTNFNVAHNANEVTALFDDQPFNTGERSVNRVEVGQPIGAFQMLRFDGVDPATGDAIYYDANGDGDITSADRVIVGSPHPDYFGGMTNNFALGAFDLKVFLSFRKGGKIFNAIRLFSDEGGYYPDNKFADVLDRWQQPGDVTDVPRASYNGDSGAREISSRFLEDASYLRIQDVTLGWNLPSSIASATRMSSARLYVSVKNLHTFTDYSGYSPDVNSNGSGSTAALGTDFYAYPLARTFSIGISGEL